MITMSLDTALNVAYIELTDEPVAETVALNPNVNVDLDAAGTVVGVELLSLAADLPVADLLTRFTLPPMVGFDRLLSLHLSIRSGVHFQVPGQGYSQPAHALQIA
jgi:uncharacterized protein YuzE